MNDVIHTLGGSTRHFTGSLPSHVPLQAVLAPGGSRRDVLPQPRGGHVHALVPFEVAEGTAGKGADVTLVGFFPGVNAQVSLQVHQLGRGVRAQRAVEGLLAVVRLHVALHVVGVARREAAQVARVQFGQLVLDGQRLVAQPVAQRFTVQLQVGARAHPAHASERRTEVGTFGFPGGFAAPQAVRAHQVYAWPQGFVAELSAAPAGQVGGERGLGLSGAALVLPPVVGCAVRVVRFTLHAELAVGGALLITQGIHGEPDLSSYFWTGKTDKKSAFPNTLHVS